MTRSRTDFSEVAYGRSAESVEAGDHRVVLRDRDEQWRHDIRNTRYDSPYIHEVVVTGLDYDSTYYYKVGSWEDGYSGIYSFRTRPADPDATVTFAWFGDQDTRRGNENVLEALLDHGTRFHFWLVVGDLSYADGRGSDWDTYGDMVQEAAARFPTMFTIGNHENEGWYVEGAGYEAFLARWRNGENSENQHWWSVDFGPMHLAHLSSEHEMEPDSPQIVWLRSDLEEANLPENRLLRPWVIVTVHRPPYSSGAHGSDMRMRRGIQDLVREFNVQVVFSGHDHNYERILPAHDGEVTLQKEGSVRDPYLYEVHNENGPGMDAVHVVAGSGGRGTRACRNQAFTAGDCLEEHGYNVVEVNRKQMTMRFHDTRGRVRDEWKMCLTPDCGDAPPLPEGYEQPTNVPDPTWPPPPPYCNFHACRTDWVEGGAWCQASQDNCVDGCIGYWCAPDRTVLARPGGMNGEDSKIVAEGANLTAGECFIGGCAMGSPAEGAFCRKSESNCNECSGEWCPEGGNRLQFRAALDVRELAAPRPEVLEAFQMNDPVTYEGNATAGLEPPAAATAAKASFVMRFPAADFATLQADPAALAAFTQTYRAYIATVAGVEEGQVSIASVSQGVLVDTLVTWLAEEEGMEGVAESLTLLEELFADRATPPARDGMEDGTVVPGSVVISFANPYDSPRASDWTPPGTTSAATVSQLSFMAALLVVLLVAEAIHG